MTFTDMQKTELAKPLDKRNVASRTQSGRQMSYVEGWHVIAEANRIFGFDGWARETIDLREVRPPELVRNSNGKETWRVGFICKVRVTAGGVVREGTGFGSGALPDLGEAYESAVKESETDAMKRALMTFGNPFGLALYDKTQANVVDEPAERPRAQIAAPVTSVEGYLGFIDNAATLDALQTVFGEAWTAHTGLNSRQTIKAHYDARKSALTPEAKNLGQHLDNLQAQEQARNTIPN